MSKEYILPIEEFKKFFTNGFWRAFHNNSLPLSIPKNQQAKELLLNKLYESIIQRKYYPHVPEATIYIDKDHGVTRCVPVAQRSGVQYFRFADDQFIFLNDPNLKPKLLHELSLELRRWGLNINQKKVHLWNRAELIEHRSFPIMAIFANDEDKKDPEKIRAFASAYLSIPPEKLKALWHFGFPLLKRLLWCDLNVLPLDQRTELFARYLADDFIKKANVSILDRIYSLLKPAQRSEFVSKLLDLAEKLIHNEFHFHLRRFLKDKRLDSSAVCRRLKEIS
jgi:hypothetical protein